MTCVLGIDPSPAKTGLVVLQATDKVAVPVLRHMSLCRPKPKVKGHDRQSAHASDVIDLLNEFRPALVVIEGYGLNFAHKSSVVPLVELGGLLRYFLRQYEYPYLCPPPGSHKEFITGKGNATKSKIIEVSKSRWGLEAASDDEADAYGLAFIGLAYLGAITGLTQREREILGSLKLSA